MTQESDQEAFAHLQELVRKHNVFYAVYQERVLKEESMERVGFDLELYGVHDHPQGIINPGCSQCEEVYEDLKQLAEWILPKEERASVYKIAPFDQALHMPPSRQFRPEVELQIRILHRHDPEEPIDDCERLCLKEMREKLAALGAREGK
jgi:hypothetical protein